jgi:hypothetical protein
MSFVRAQSIVFASLFVAVLVLAPHRGLGQELTLETATPNPGCFDVVEFQIGGVGPVADPFDPAVAAVSLEVTSGQRTWSVPAFFSQSYERRRVGSGPAARDWFYPVGLPGWRARFACPEVGAYEAVAVQRDGGHRWASAPVTIRCRPSDRTGFVRVSLRDPRWLEFSTGQPFFPIGQNLAFIGSQQYVTVSRAEETFARLAANGANYVRVWTGCEDWALAIEARKSAWERSWERQSPVRPLPGNPDRRGVLLTNTSLAVRPSHDVALRPSTAYVVTGRVRGAAGKELRLEVQGTTSPNLRPSTPDTWSTFRHEFRTSAQEHWLSGMRFQPAGTGAAWLDALSLQELEGGPELLWEADVNRPTRGWYNPLDAFWLDELLRAAQHHGIHLQLCLLTRDLYMGSLRDADSADYTRAIADAKSTFRYAVARWGAFTSVAAWEYWNEIDPGLPTDRFYTELGEFLESIDPYRHLRTTSTWGPSPKDCRHPKLDLADVHFYLRPADRGRLRDEVEAVLDRARWLREHAPGKPAHQGESGLADDQWRITGEMQRSAELVDFHNMLWASALSGTTGTALPWWWERLDQRNHYPLYRPLRRFLADVPWSGGEVQPFVGTAAEERVRLVGLRTRTQVWLWCFHREAAWRHVVSEGRSPGVMQDAEFELSDWAPATARVEWWDTRTGEVLGADRVVVEQGRLTLRLPAFTRDVAGRIRE